MMEQKKCYLCGSEDYKVIHHGVRGDADIDVLKCEKCGLVRLSHFISNTDKFYQESGMQEDASISIEKRRIDAFPDDHRRFEYTRGRISNKTVLDFGCGAGGYLLEAKGAALKVYGVELEDVMHDAINREGISCFHSIDEAERELTGCVDIITLWHVLEHLEDPIYMLERLKKLLSANGRIIIEVPNADDALLSLFQCEAFADFTYWKCHLYLYTNRTLRELVEKAGFKVCFQTQIQRYTLANHLYWLSKGKPGGHVEWESMRRYFLDLEYGKMLAEIGRADTLLIEISNV